jgi:hypothetical protein
MMRRCFSILTVLVFWNSTAFAQGVNSTGPNEGSSSSGREFIASCTYGVLAGTLVGAASLAFVSKPSENLNRVARGASIGLYTGILLGLYVVYVVPAMEDDGSQEDPVAHLENSPFRITPTFHETEIDGLSADVTVWRW